jgi:hypothetical protein
MQPATIEAWAGNPEFRVWREQPREAVAKFLASDGDTVTLLTTDGQITTVPVRRLSSEDQTFIQAQTSSSLGT